MGRLLADYLAPIAGPVMITAANAIAGAAKIGASHPGFSKKIIAAILQVEHAHYQTDECRNIAIGHAITALATIGKSTPTVLAFVERQLCNPRPATRKKAEAFLATRKEIRSKSPCWLSTRQLSK